jgi:putative endonuclease
MSSADDLTQQARQAAEDYLVRRGFRILDRHWRCTIGQIDIVAVDHHTLVVCEVKARSGTRFGATGEDRPP